MPRIFDVIIIGGGIMGCSIAYQLAQRGVKAALLEKKSIGAGSTGQSSALIRQHYSNKLTAQMALYGVKAFSQLEEELGTPCGFIKSGFIALIAAKDHEGLKANIELQRSVGIQAEILDPRAIADLMPGIVLDDVKAAAYEPEAGYADPHLTVNAYAAAAKRGGVEFFLNTQVTGIRFAGDKVVGVDTPDDRFDAPQVINCAGPWGARVAQMAGFSAPINSCRTQTLFFNRPTGIDAIHPMIADFVHATYFRPETGNLILGGMIDPSEADAIVDPDHFNELHDDDFVLKVGERLLRRCPGMADSACTNGYSSLYAITPDWHPIVDEVPPGSGCYICSGFSGHGFKLGPAVGLMVADMLTGISQPQFDPRFFRLSRYEEGAPICGKYEYSIAG